MSSHVVFFENRSEMQPRETKMCQECGQPIYLGSDSFQTKTAVNEAGAVETRYFHNENPRTKGNRTCWNTYKEKNTPAATRYGAIL